MRDHLSFTTTFPETFSFIFGCRWTPVSETPFFQDHFCLISRVVLREGSLYKKKILLSILLTCLHTTLIILDCYWKCCLFFCLFYCQSRTVTAFVLCYEKTQVRKDRKMKWFCWKQVSCNFCAFDFTPFFFLSSLPNHPYNDQMISFWSLARQWWAYLGSHSGIMTTCLYGLTTAQESHILNSVQFTFYKVTSCPCRTLFLFPFYFLSRGWPAQANLTVYFSLN